MKLTIQLGDNLDLLKQYSDNYFDSVVTDCPYGLGKEPNALKLMQDWIDHGYHEVKGKGFMGKSWDAFVPQPVFWKEVFRVLKPGGYVLAFFGTRTYDWGTLAIRLAGFEIRDMICWHYGSGFPKSLDISKQLDKKAGAERQVTGKGKAGSGMNPVKGFGKITTLSKKIKCCRNCGNQLNKRKHSGYDYECLTCDESFFDFETIDKEIAVGAKKEWDETTASTNEAKQWDGYGTALKPATEPICVARKPIEGTVAENVLKYGTGGINLDGCRIEFESEEDLASATFGTGTNIIGGNYVGSKLTDGRKNIEANKNGRFPANVIFDPFMAKELDKQTGILTSGKPTGTRKASNNVFGYYKPGQDITGVGDSGGASRFFYCAKASQDERNAGCEGLNKSKSGVANDKGRSFNGVCINSGKRLQGCDCGNCKHDQGFQIMTANFHPTVKPISLMSYLQRLVTPKGGKTLDPFAGSGTSGCSAYFENIGEIVLMEMDETYLPIIEARTAYWSIEYNRRKYLEDLKDPAKQPENQLKLFSA